MHICVIPAKLESQRVSLKNIRIIDGAPIINHVISKLLHLEFFDEIILSTDSVKVAEIVKNDKISVLMRTSKNDCSISDLLIEVTENCIRKGVNVDYVSCCFPTSLLLDTDYILQCCKSVINNNHSSSLIVKRYSHPIERGLRLDSNNSVSFINSKYQFTRTQDLPITYFDSGQFYCINALKLMKTKKIFMTDTIGIIAGLLDSVDVDIETDWNDLEKLYSYKKQK